MALQNGTVDYVLDYTDSGRYAVFIKDISSEESDQYVKELKENGYSEIHSDTNDVSVGTMLESRGCLFKYFLLGGDIRNPYNHARRYKLNQGFINNKRFTYRKSVPSGNPGKS